ncbi:transporter substrate-binding domain-containing protein [Halomonas sp. YLB-10]|uniref:Transporter substrate-binding domain-containing protein n=2 Tax=Halomonas TaxID=2745 RepID=A0AAU7KLM4_9GAMM|nr:ABC transporter substrate-binding protein [Halomonas sp.]RQW72503.1 ABC transporter substrate-binding protein [Halomonas sp. YLB-10]|tara:strand:+ start:5819 stop:6610 length:792 start_codon:yes stop_codon:yes gene_type:complete
MIKIKHLVASTALTLMAVGTQASAVAAELTDIQESGKLRVGMLVDFPPFGVLDTSGNPDGYDAAVATELAESLGVDLQIVPVTGPNRIPYLLSGQVDVLVASLGITPARSEKVDFSDPYAAISIAVYGDASKEVESKADLADYIVGVARGSTQEKGVVEAAPEGTEIRRFDDGAGAVQALMSGQVDLLGASNVVMGEVIAVTGGRFEKKLDLSNQLQGISVAPGSDELLEQINSYLAQIKSDGTLNDIHQEWLGEPLPDYLNK